MNKQETLERIRQLGLLAVLRGPDPESTLRMVKALVEGGVLGIEITFTTPEAVQIARRINDLYGERILLGMGTLTEPEHAALALDAGACFLVSPHFDPDLAQAMRETGLAAMIGAFTPSEVMQAKRAGADAIKIFPGSLGGPSYLKTLRGPFPDLLFMPTGGIDLDNIRAWFAAGAFAVGAGSSLCARDLALQGRFDEIIARAEAFTRAVADARLSL